ncbi:uncharacterized protein [Palaemon carinicauda]|uniref:uncharacterized protein n=1 Tax=Palaemon carinicauda TaxID=392227 RepID=UPI0035B5D7D2
MKTWLLEQYASSTFNTCPHQPLPVMTRPPMKIWIIDPQAEPTVTKEPPNIPEHWWRIINYLELVGRSGVILNPAKFQFSSTEVDFAGFHVGETDVKPLLKYLNAIATFPRPKNITDIRAWFGLVNQVSHYGRATDLMEPFRPLLSPKVRFQWGPELENAFERSKAAIIREIKKGVEISNPNKPTCLNPDWSKVGIGYWLRQKHCICEALTPGCCPDGWKTPHCICEALTPGCCPDGWKTPPSRIAISQGRRKVVCTNWGGSTDRSMGTRGQPILHHGVQSLDNSNGPQATRENSKGQRTRHHHEPKAHPTQAANTKPNTSEVITALNVIRSTPNHLDDTEAAVIAVVRSIAESIGAVTWGRVKGSTAVDPCLQSLIPFIENGFPSTRYELTEELQPYWPYQDRLSTVDSVFMRDKRVLIPSALQGEILRAQHGAHQGTNKMQNRAQGSVFWPGLTKDIKNTRNSCQACWGMSPSQPSVPTQLCKAIAADFFEMKYTGYLVIIDEFSGARGFSKAILHYFTIFGVPQELNTAGGPEFSAKETQSLTTALGTQTPSLICVPLPVKWAGGGSSQVHETPPDITHRYVRQPRY